LRRKKSNNKDSPKATNVEGMKEDHSLANFDLEDEEDKLWLEETVYPLNSKRLRLNI